MTDDSIKYYTINPGWLGENLEDHLDKELRSLPHHYQHAVHTFTDRKRHGAQLYVHKKLSVCILLLSDIQRHTGPPFAIFA